jgi:predicted short-subunit dehydrogenase-like oxidoreductase (DUF2520 family)
MSLQKIALIGSGRVATQLGKRLHEKGKTITRVFSRNPDNALVLAEQVNAKPISKIDQLGQNADLYIISVVDDAIADITENLQLKNRPVVHTSGSVPMAAIGKISENHGVFYPLQTFAKDKDVDFSDIPICIEASNKELESRLMNLAGEISTDVRLINSEQRLVIHIAAVFASNFTNFMYLMGEDLLQDAGVSFDILLPLIRETAQKVNFNLPEASQTGPARRGDVKVMEKHLKMLESHPEKKEVYRQISQYITAHFQSINQKK